MNEDLFLAVHAELKKCDVDKKWISLFIGYKPPFYIDIDNETSVTGLMCQEWTTSQSIAERLHEGDDVASAYELLRKLTLTPALFNTLCWFGDSGAGDPDGPLVDGVNEENISFVLSIIESTLDLMNIDVVQYYPHDYSLGANDMRSVAVRKSGLAKILESWLEI
jgi:hypothetical protein